MVGSYKPPTENRDTMHDGSEHLAINNTFRRRFLTRLALHTTAKFYKRDGLCFPISKKLIVKRGFRVHLTEGATMEYVAKNTSLPVPKVYCSFVHKNTAYIVMERIRGEMLPRAFKKISDPEIENIFVQLRNYVQELRALKPAPGRGVESCNGGSLYDSRINHCNPRFGPFQTVQEFHTWLRKGLNLEDVKDREKDEEWYEVQDMINLQDGPWPPLKFTHGDLNPSNVLVRGNKVVGIIDWEFSGWYPHYWEYTAAWFTNIMTTDWQEMLAKFLDQPQPNELKMEEVRNKWWGQ